MLPTRPDLSDISEEVRLYIEALEKLIKRDISSSGASEAAGMLQDGPRTMFDSSSEVGWTEPPTKICLITSTSKGIAKRTFRHLYTRQRRGGMGVFDLETSEGDPPSIIALAEESRNLIILTDHARAFRLPVRHFVDAPVRNRGNSITSKLNLLPQEKLLVILPDKAEGYIALSSEKGMVRLLRHHVFGEYMKPGMNVFDPQFFGLLSSACWVSEYEDLFIATRNGRAIRFAKKLIPPQGTQGIRLMEEDRVIGITPVDENSGVFMIAADGKGTIRLMRGFSANKAPGAGGKIAMNTNQLICAINSDHVDDIFVITRQSKIIRFHVDDVPPKEGVVQGVNCIALRSDWPTAVTVNHHTN